ncbi:hypothetical protein RHDC4_03189 [Rhodocyclaceae bacterium]|nr:hypothetical protein RHDC4_03189 [Rhodocyclaceae bacterium]
MKLSLSSSANLNTVTAQGPGYVDINRQRHTASLVLMPDRILESWGTAGFDGLTEADFTAVADLKPELVLLGTGARQRFPAPRLLRPLIEAGVGCEVMDLAAACRTYTILVAEGRRVAAALLIE